MKEKIFMFFVVMSMLSGCVSFSDTDLADTSGKDNGMPYTQVSDSNHENTEDSLVENRGDDISAPVFTCSPVPNHIVDIICGKSYKENTPFGYDKLSYLNITYINFDGEHCVGEMIVSADIGAEVLEIFQELYRDGFPIDKMRLVDFYDADDDLSMENNNTISFNFRYITNSDRISNHGYGLAIDINPVQNPYISGDTILPKSGAEYAERTDVRKGMILKDDVVYNAFISRGWTWGGDWNTPRDYHHFEKTLAISE